MQSYSLNQAYVFIIFIIVGISIGVIFDFFRAIRKSTRCSCIITYMQDLFFWIVTGFLILASIFFFNSGEIRMYIFVGIMIGIILYIVFLTKIVFKFHIVIINLLINLFKIAIIPLKCFFDIIQHIIIKFVNYLKKSTENFKKTLEKRKDFKI